MTEKFSRIKKILAAFLLITICAIVFFAFFRSNNPVAQKEPMSEKHTNSSCDTNEDIRSFNNLAKQREIKYVTLKKDLSVKLALITASTKAEQTLGLSNIPCIPQNSGMLFIFDHPDYYAFWMKDTLTSLDMAWLDENYKVVFIAQNVLPSSYPEIIKPKPPTLPALYVVEMASGETQRLGIFLGTTFVPDFNARDEKTNQ